MNEPKDEWPEPEPVEFELPSGYRVRVTAAHYWEILTESDKALGQKPKRYFAIRIYSNEESDNNRMELHHEFRRDHEFVPEALGKAWQWLGELIERRGHIECDRLDDFLELFAQELSLDSFVEEDAVEHIAHLPELHVPEMFDYVDDSDFNDQNERRARAEARGLPRAGTDGFRRHLLRRPRRAAL